MTAPILYCGDTSLDGAASYLAGMMTHFGWAFNYIPSHQKVTHSDLEESRSLLILSDYPAAQFDDDLQQLAVRQIEQGTGLLMIGGWESFHGFGGDWNGTSLGITLPVEISTEDDRTNFDQPALLHPAGWKSRFWDLPWFERPPTIGGLNQFQPKAGAEVLLEVTSYAPRYIADKNHIDWQPAGPAFPALVTGVFGNGKTAAFATDVAPHWVGGFVDWGTSRIFAQAPIAGAIEVGSDYASFWKQLLSWTGNLK